jgi:putative hydrolase of the HAD superfamily
MALRFVIFDMDDVLCHYDLGKRLRALSRLSGKTPRDIRAAIWDSGFEDAADSGAYPTVEAYLAGFGERLGYRISQEEWIAARRVAMEPWREVLDLAAAISCTHETLIYTNNGPLLKPALPELFPEAHGIFGERTFCSFEFGTKKPDPRSFELLLQRLGAAPSEAWFIDDKKSNVEGARLAGLDASQFVSFEKLRAEAVARDLPAGPS